MNFFNIIGAAAAGAQRADELAARLKASKKTDDSASKLLQKILETGYATSKDFSDKGYSLDTMKLMDVDNLNPIYADAVTYAKNVTNRAKNIKEVRQANEAGNYSVLSKDGQDIFTHLSPINYLKTIRGGSDIEINEDTIANVIEHNKRGLTKLINFYGGLDNADMSKVNQLIKTMYTPLDTRRQEGTLSFQNVFTDDEELKRVFLPFADQIGSKDPQRINEVLDQIKKFSIFGAPNLKPKEYIPTTKKVYDSADTVSITSNMVGENSEDMASFLGADISANKESAYNANVTNTSGKIREHGLKSILGLTKRFIGSPQNVQYAEDLVESFGNMTPEARGKLEGVSLMRVVGEAFKQFRVPKDEIITVRSPDGSYYKRKRSPKPPEEETLRLEKTTTAKLIKTAGVLSNTMRQVNRINTVYETMGLVELAERSAKGDTFENNSTFKNILDKILANIPEDGTAQIEGRTITGTQIRNTGIDILNKLNEEELKFLRQKGAVLVSTAPSETASFIESMMANLEGIAKLTGEVFTIKNLNDMKIKMQINYSDGQFENADRVVQQKLQGTSFSNYAPLKAEEENYKKQLKKIEQFKDKPNSIAFLKAQAAAQLSFSKIQLAYTFAAISQGGEGSARTISDADFANNLRSLFTTSGPGLIGVMNDIKNQIEIEQEANAQLVALNGTGKQAEAATMFKVLEQQDQLRRDRQSKKVIGLDSEVGQQSAAAPRPDQTEIRRGISIQNLIGSNLTKRPVAPTTQSFTLRDENGQKTNRRANYTFKIVSTRDAVKEERRLYYYLEGYKRRLKTAYNKKFPNNPLTPESVGLYDTQILLNDIVIDFHREGDSPFRYIEIDDKTNDGVLMKRLQPSFMREARLPVNNLHSITNIALEGDERVKQSKDGKTISPLTQAEYDAKQIYFTFLTSIFSDLRQNFPR